MRRSFCIRTFAVVCATSLVPATASIAQAAENYEAAPSLPAAQLAPAALIKGANYDVADPVPIERFLARAELHSPYGTFRVSGVDMLAQRVRELRAIEELKKVQSSSAFGEALAKSATAPVKLVGSLVTDPGTTVENVASGVGTVLGRIGYSVKSGIENAGDAMSKPSSPPKQPTEAAAGEGEPPSFTDDPLGYNRARREWAKKLDVDPYTSNPVLRPLLDDAARATFAGNFAVGMAVGAVAAPLQYATDFETTVKDSVWDQPPGDLAQRNEETLKRMGVPADVGRAFLRNRWFTPTLQTALVAALDKLNGVSGRDALIRSAASVTGEVPARFLVRCVALLAIQHGETPLAHLRMRGIVPIGEAKDRSLVVAAAVDYLYWSEEAAAFAKASDVAGAHRLLLVQGRASTRATEEFRRAGWTLRTGVGRNP